MFYGEKVGQELLSVSLRWRQGFLPTWPLVSEEASLRRGQGQKKEWSVLGLDAETLKRVTCLALLCSCKTDRGDGTLTAALMRVPWV